MRFTILATLVCLIVAPTAFAAPAAFDLDATKATLSREIEELLADTGIPSVSIALFDADGIVWTRAFGYANVAMQVPASPESVYCTGSCFKPITAMAVMQLAERGKLRLDDPINDYLGERRIEPASPDAPPITFRHLLSHYSGLMGPDEREGHIAEIVPLWDRRLPKSLDRLVSELRAADPPGKAYRYSNYAYSLAGFLVAKISGQSYEQYIVENILRPVGVKLAGPVNPTPAMFERLALPYRLEGNRPVPETLYRLDVYPAGELYLSAPAMARVMLTHLNGGKYGDAALLSPASVEAMRTRQFGGNDGLDFGIKTADGERLIMHGGGVPGYSSKCILAVDAKVGVYVVANATRAQLPVRILAQAAIDLMRGKQLGTGLVRERAGVGILLAKAEGSGLLQITDIYPRSPASRAGLSRDLLIARINGDAVEGKSIRDCLRMLAGPRGAALQLEIVEAEGKTRTVEVKLERFRVPS